MDVAPTGNPEGRSASGGRSACKAVPRASAHGMDAYIPAAVTGHIPYAARKGPVPPHGSGFLGLVAIMLAGYSRENDRLLIHPSL